MQIYQTLLRHILENGEAHSDRTGVGTRSVFGYQIRHDLRKGFPLLTTKRVAFRWVAEELRWFLLGRTDEGWLRERGVDIWQEWATAEQCAKFGREAGDLGPVYGAMWRKFPVGEYRQEPAPAEIDQIQTLLQGLMDTPNSRRLIVSGWHPYYAQRVELPPCHTLWQCKVSKQYLSLQLYARSIDAFLGLPFDMASYALLTHLLAHVTGLTARDLIISFGDLHIYNSHMDAVNECLRRAPRPLPVLTVNPNLPTGMFGLLRWRVEDLRLEGYNPLPKIPAPVAI